MNLKEAPVALIQETVASVTNIRPESVKNAFIWKECVISEIKLICFFSPSDQSMMTDDNYEKGTQTPRGKSKVKTLRDSYGSGDFSEERAQSRRAQRSESESETESETGSSETDSETESETDSQGTRLSNEGSVVVVSMKDAKYAQKVTSESMQQSRPKSGHIVRGYKSDSASQSDYAPRPPSARRYRDTYSARSDMSPRSVRRAIIEVEETASVDLNEDRMMKSVVVSQDKGHRRRLVQEGEVNVVFYFPNFNVLTSF